MAQRAAQAAGSVEHVVDGIMAEPVRSLCGMDRSSLRGPHTKPLVGIFDTMSFASPNSAPAFVLGTGLLVVPSTMAQRGVTTLGLQLKPVSNTLTISTGTPQRRSTMSGTP